MSKLTPNQVFLRSLAQRGATYRLEELHQEMAALEKLINGGAVAGNGSNGHASFSLAKTKGPAQTAPVNTPRKKPTRKRMTLKARKAHSLRMKKFWAGKRKSEKAAAASA